MSKIHTWTHDESLDKHGLSVRVAIRKKCIKQKILCIFSIAGNPTQKSVSLLNAFQRAFRAEIAF